MSNAITFLFFPFPPGETSSILRGSLGVVGAGVVVVVGVVGFAVVVTGSALGRTLPAIGNPVLGRNLVSSTRLALSNGKGSGRRGGPLIGLNSVLRGMLSNGTDLRGGISGAVNSGMRDLTSGS